MKSLADGLPPEIAKQVHPDWRKNEAEYWAARDQLLGQYRGQWIGFANGSVLAFGTRPVTVFQAAHQAAEHPYVICVGREDEPYRMRRTNFAYDTSYSGEALPVIRAEFRRLSGIDLLRHPQPGQPGRDPKRNRHQADQRRPQRHPQGNPGRAAVEARHDNWKHRRRHRRFHRDDPF